MAEQNVALVLVVVTDDITVGGMLWPNGAQQLHLINQKRLLAAFLAGTVA